MVDKLPTFKQLLVLLQQVPYLASKNLYRVATHFLEMDQQKFEQFCRVLIEAKKNLEKCSTCFAWKEKQNPCLFCSDQRRNHAIICVIESWQDLLAIEKTSGYRGVYHVLGGSMCPLEGIGPEHLAIMPLVKRSQAGVEEIILALNQTPEGEATASYIAQKLAGAPIKITCLAQGVPVGSSLEFMDRLTVYKALSDRRPF